MVVLKGYIIVPDEDLSAVKRALIEHTRLTIQEEGCLRFDVTPDENDPNRFNVYEEFRDKIDFEHHQKRAKASVWGKVTENVSRFYQVEGAE